MATIALGRHSVQQRPWIRRLVGLGHAAKGVIYLVVGGLALQLALGDGGRITDKQGVLGEVLKLPLGTPLLATLAVGLLAYAIWEITGAFVIPVASRGMQGVMKRALVAVKGLMYGGIGWQAMRIVIGAGQTRSRGPEGYARDVMAFPLGDWVLALVGVGIAVFGAHQVWLAAQTRFDEDMDPQRLRREGLGWVLNVGRAGIAARGVVFVMMGVLMTRAGLQRRPSEAGGMADSLAALLSQPFGALLLGVTAAGLVCFGVWQILHARYGRI